MKMDAEMVFRSRASHLHRLLLKMCLVSDLPVVIRRHLCLVVLDYQIVVFNCVKQSSFIDAIKIPFVFKPLFHAVLEFSFNVVQRPFNSRFAVNRIRLHTNFIPILKAKMSSLALRRMSKSCARVGSN